MSVRVRVTRTAQATWQGDLGEDGGRIGVGSGAYEGPFTLRARVEDVERATNPEELIAAAEAGCFTMSLANLLSEAGHPPPRPRATAQGTTEPPAPASRGTRPTPSGPPPRSRSSNSTQASASPASA